MSPTGDHNQPMFHENTSRFMPKLNPAPQTKAAGQIDFFDRKDERVLQSAVPAVTWGVVVYQKLSEATLRECSTGRVQTRANCRPLFWICCLFPCPMGPGKASADVPQSPAV